MLRVLFAACYVAAFFIHVLLPKCLNNLCPFAITKAFTKIMKRVGYLLLGFIAWIAADHAAAQQPLLNLHPRPKAAFERSGNPFLLDKDAKIVIASAPTIGTGRAISYLQSFIQQKIGDTLQVVQAANYSGSHGILIGEPAFPDTLTYHLAHVMPWGESMPDSQGYVLDIAEREIVAAGVTANGTFNGISTLAQLMTMNGASVTIPAVHIWDEPDYQNRWVFSMHNLQVAGNRQVMKTILDTMAYHKLNGLQQNDFKYNILEIEPDFYFANVDTLKKNLAKTNIPIIPGVAGIGYSEGLLFEDPNLAEGFEARTTCFIEGDTARIVADPSVSFPNGGFEKINNNQFSGWTWYDGANQSSLPDSSIVYSGKYSARCANFALGNSAGNCRFNRLVTCKPNRYYIFTAWVKTDNLDVQPQLLALGKHAGKPDINLTNTGFAIPSTTNGWKKVQVAFNTMDCDQMNLYAGVWGATRGTIWWDDIEILDAGFINILRRPGAPLHVKNAKSAVEYKEGIDYYPLVDSVMLRANGSYTYHTGPTLRRIASGSIKNGDSLLVSYFHPVTVYGDENGIGSTMLCISEDTTYKVIGKQMKQVNDLYHPDRFFLGHDEIRSMNSDSSCLRRNLSPAQILADNANRCYGILKGLNPNVKAYIWSDMFDSLHNAVNNYYLVNGDLRGDWNLLDKDLTIVNWNSGHRTASLKQFASLGFTQMTSPYYDEGNTQNIRDWRLATEDVPGVLGSLYTTWSADYRFLTPFADYAWSAGPYVIHTPLDTTVITKLKANGKYQIEANVYADPYDVTDAVTSVSADIFDGNQIEHVVFTNDAKDHYIATAQHIPTAGYVITAVNKQGLQRVLPRYIVPLANDTATSGVVAALPAQQMFALYPSPATRSSSVNFMVEKQGNWDIALFNELGELVSRQSGIARFPFEHGSIATFSLRAGVYIAKLTNGGKTSNARLVILE